jgi:tetratricopeptide (TPR) repeat protein/DNA-binding CsgD family transcriptional regulator
MANDAIFREARTLQRNGQYSEAIEAFKNYLSIPVEKGELTGKKLEIYTEALVQLMNTFQSAGEPDKCITALQELYKSSTPLQNECLRDFYSVLGYALSRTERMKEAEETTLKALTLPLYRSTPERYFRDYAYAAAVFYSNPGYRKEVVNWCQEALEQAKSCKNTSGQQWVMSMLGSLYKKNGDLNNAFQLFQKSIDEAKSRGDDLGIINSINSLIDLFLYWDIPEYANLYATEAIGIEKRMSTKNPMVSAQTYINKVRALHQVGQTDSIPFYIEKAQQLCETLPYNSGMVDIDLLNGILHTDVRKLQQVALQGTVANRAKAYHQLAQAYLKHGNVKEGERALDSLHIILNKNDLPLQIRHIDYKPILDHYMKKGNLEKVEQYIELMLQEQNAFKERSLNYNFVETVVDLQTGSRLQELKIIQLKQANQRLWLLIAIVISVITIAVIATLLFYQKIRHARQMRQADKQVASLVNKLNQSNVEKEKISEQVKDFLNAKDNRQELETLTPYILKESGEIKFRQCFELLYPLFLPRLREKVPSVTRREELLSMLIALNQDNKNIAELLAIAPRSVLMLRHRFRQKIGMTTEFSLENFIEELLA